MCGKAESIYTHMALFGTPGGVPGSGGGTAATGRNEKGLVSIIAAVARPVVVERLADYEGYLYG